MHDDAHAQRWLAALRNGSPAEKAEARRNLSLLFEARGLLAEATDLLVTNAREGHRDAGTFRSLARLYRAQGDEYNAAAAALEAARLSDSGATDGSRPPQPGETGREPPTSSLPRQPGAPQTPPPAGGPPRGPGPRPRAGSGPAGPAGRTYGRGEPSWQPGPPGGSGPAAWGSKSPSGSPWTSTRRWLGPRIVGGILAFATLMAGLGMSVQHPITGLFYGLSACCLALAVAAQYGEGIRRLVRIPSGPLGSGLLVFAWLLLFLAGGAMLPRITEPDRPAPWPTPAPLPTRTATPVRTLSPATPTLPSPRQQQPAPPRPTTTPRTQPTASPDASAGPVPSGSTNGDGTRLVVVNAAPDGARLRPAPGDGDALKILADGAQVTALGEASEADGTRWRHVRDDTGTEGWVAADFLAAVLAVTPTTLAAVAAPLLAAPTVEPPVQTAPPVTATPSPALTAAPAPTSPPAPVPTVPTSPPGPAPAATVARTAPAQSTATSAPVAVTRAPTVAPTPRPAATASGGPGTAASRTAPQGTACPASHPIKGNHSSSGEWIYHRPGGQFYGRTNPEDCFATEADARAAGYRASLR